MAQLHSRDVTEILQMLENGINLIQRLGKVERMRMRNKIRKQFLWLSELSSPSAEMAFQKLQSRLPEVFSRYPYGFSDRVKKLIVEKWPR